MPNRNYEYRSDNEGRNYQPNRYDQEYAGGRAYPGNPQYGQSRHSTYGDSSLKPSSQDSASENRGHFGKGPKNYKRSDDRIQEEVNEALYRHHDIDASDIDVSVENGVVTLSGTVDERETRRMAEREIESISGVVDVRNELSIKRNESSSSGSPYSTKSDARGESKSKSSKSTSQMM